MKKCELEDLKESMEKIEYFEREIEELKEENLSLEKRFNKEIEKLEEENRNMKDLLSDSIVIKCESEWLVDTDNRLYRVVKPFPQCTLCYKNGEVFVKVKE